MYTLTSQLTLHASLSKLQQSRGKGKTPISFEFINLKFKPVSPTLQGSLPTAAAVLGWSPIFSRVVAF